MSSAAILLDSLRVKEKMSHKKKFFPLRDTISEAMIQEIPNVFLLKNGNKRRGVPIKDQTGVLNKGIIV